MLKHSAALDRVFFALADPTRRAILERLGRAPATVSELAAPLDMTLAAVAQHLDVLVDSGLVTTEKQGRVRTCRIAPGGLTAAETWIARRRGEWERRLERVGERLVEERPQRGRRRS